MKYDRLLSEMGFPGPVTPQVPQNRIRQTYRGLPGAGLGCASCALPPDSLGALPAGAFAGAIAMLAGTRRRNSPGTMSPEVAISAGLSKGGGGHHGGHHHGGGGRGRGGGSWWGAPGYYDSGDTYYVETGPQCPIGYAWDPVGLKCVRIPTVVLRGLQGLGSTATDWCTAFRAGSAAAGHPADATTTPPTPATGAFLACDQITDAGFRMACKAAIQAAQAGISSGCAHVDDPGVTLPPISLMNQAATFGAALNPGTVAAINSYTPPKSMSASSGSSTVLLGVGAIAILGLAYMAFVR